MSTRRKRTAGLTLIEVLIAVTLLSLLSVGMLMALQIGLAAFSKTDAKLMDNRRVAGAQRLVEQELQGLVPLVVTCGEGNTRIGFFQGEAQVMRLASTFSLQQAWRGQPQILEMFVIPSESGNGVRLVVNEIPYTGAVNAGRFCTGMGQNPAGATVPRFLPVSAQPTSFILADKLAYCRFLYLTPPKEPRGPQLWFPTWAVPGWPIAIRIEMAPLEPDASRLQPITVVAPLFVHRGVEIPYGDF